MAVFGKYARKDEAFTLVELSIVLVILGLLVGGVLTGQSLIRAAELRTVTTQYNSYITAVNTFKDKYFAIPGDMTNAASFWTSLSAANNGNGNGVMDAAAGANTTGELFQFWNELSLAGLIEGKYTGLSGPINGNDHVPGSNVPRSKIATGGWGVYDWGNMSGVDIYTASYDHILIFGAYVGSIFPYGPLLKPEDAWNIDTKMDDSKPGTGKIIAREGATWSGAASAKCTTSSNGTDYAGAYNLIGTNPICSFFFIKAF